MPDLIVPKQMDGYVAKFLRFAGPEKLVIEVDGAERTVTRECWSALPPVEPLCGQKGSRAQTGN